jgi:hypothetical protein
MNGGRQALAEGVTDSLSNQSVELDNEPYEASAARIY